jgi:malonyl-CoA O-methyltransferase
MPRSSLQRSFARVAAQYSQAARFQPLCARELMDGLGVGAASPRRVVDLGCGVGQGSSLLSSRWPQAFLLGVDFALPMLQQRLGSAALVCARAEALPLATGSVDFLWSNLVLQWCDPALFSAEVFRVLNEGGGAAISTLGPETFPELRLAFSGVDGRAHTQPFPDLDSVVRAFDLAGFSVRCESRLMTVYFEDLASLLFSIRGVGANRYRGQGQVRLGKAAYDSFVRSIESTRGAQGLPLTYQVLFLFVSKPELTLR